jgi:hypothetical protein
MFSRKNYGDWRKTSKPKNFERLLFRVEEISEEIRFFFILKLFLRFPLPFLTALEDRQEKVSSGADFRTPKAILSKRP